MSAVTVLELSIKHQLGRLALPADFFASLPGQGFQLVPLTGEEAAGIEEFPSLVRHDPFDRALLAQASAHGWRFLTADTRLLRLGLDWVVDARA